MVGTGNTASSISSLLGLNQDQTRRATSAAVPSLLAGLTGLASTPQGAERLSETVSRQETGVLDNLTGALSGRGPRLAEQGSSQLGSLMGGGMTSKLGSVLSRFTGVGEASTGKLLGLLTPVLLGFLGKQQKSMDLDASGLSNLLAGQKDNIRAAMPAGLDTALSSALPGVSQLFGGGARAAGAESSDYEEAVPRAQMGTDWRSREVYAEPAHKAGGRKWVLPMLLLLGALAALLFWGNRDRNRQQVRSSVGAPGTVSESLSGTAGSLVSDTTRVLGQAESVLTGIKDPASAEAAAPKLRQINQQLAGLRSTWNRLPESARNTAKSALQPRITNLKETAQSILNQPGIGETVRPHVDELMQNLNAFSPQ
jgi:hypothetical protein